MGTIELLITAVALAMDAFAVAVCKGLMTRDEGLKLKHMAIVGLWFGGFQGLMPLLGYLLGSTFSSYITKFDHWVAFGLLVLLGINMIKEAVMGCDECPDNSLAFGAMLTMALATSIDALAVGITFAITGVNIILAVAAIAIITFIISAAGMKIGSIFGTRFQSPAEMFGGIVLILMGVKILLEHLGVIAF